MHDIEESAQFVDFMELASQGAGQIEAETVDVHMCDPVAERVHDELQDARVSHV